MSWLDIMEGSPFYNWAVYDVWYRMSSKIPYPKSVKEYLQRNVTIAHILTRMNKLPVFRSKSRDKRVLDIFTWVTENIEYQRDITKFGHVEEWEDIDNTLTTKTGDCEDMSCLMFAMCRVAQINPMQIRLVAGEVKLQGKVSGHSWLEYQSDETMNWHIFDPALFPNNTAPFKYRKVLDDQSVYTKRWFKCTDFEFK